MDDMPTLTRIAEKLDPQAGVTRGRWFGKECLKVQGRVFAVSCGEEVAFKLPLEYVAEALELYGAHLFDPRGVGQAMRQWVQVPCVQPGTWSELAIKACAYVSGEAQALKDEVISGLVDARSKIMAATEDLSEQEQAAIFLGEWSAKELLAHLIGWDYTNCAAVQDILSGRKPAFWSHYDRDWRAYNAMLVREYRQDRWTDLIASARRSHRALMDCLHSVPATEYLKRRKLVSLLRAEARDEETHYRQIAHYFRGHA